MEICTCFNGLKFFDKTSSSCCVKTEIMPSQPPLDVVMRQSAENLHKPIIGKLEKCKLLILQIYN